MFCIILSAPLIIPFSTLFFVLLSSIFSLYSFLVSSLFFIRLSFCSSHPLLNLHNSIYPPLLFHPFLPLHSYPFRALSPLHHTPRMAAYEWRPRNVFRIVFLRKECSYVYLRIFHSACCLVVTRWLGNLKMILSKHLRYNMSSTVHKVFFEYGENLKFQKVEDEI